MNEITNNDKLKNRIYPAIKACIANRDKIVTGIFAVYAFIASSLNHNKDIINQNVSLFVAWIFTFFVVHNALNYSFNAWEQYKLEDSPEDTCQRLWYIFRVEGLFAIAMLLLIWLGYFFILKEL